VNQSVERGLAILEQLAIGERRLGELAETLGTHKSTVLRILQTMEARGFVRRTEHGAYRLGMRVMELGAAALEELDLSSAAQPGLEKIAAATGETVHLAILDRGHVVYVGKVESIHPVRMYSRVGATAPVHCTGVGKVLLAYTPEDEWPELELERFTDNTIVELDRLRRESARIREQGWGVDEQEHQESIRCIAAPVFDDRGSVVAALSVTALDSRMSRDVLDGYVPQLLEATRMITRALGGDTRLVATEEVATSAR
jgi:IclR family transcriptional regulator, KDG regulon repressor